MSAPVAAAVVVTGMNMPSAMAARRVTPPPAPATPAGGKALAGSQEDQLNDVS
jgi:hypothetical protein